ncbi:MULTISPECIES: SDR family oxidoreductase [Pseudoalteromonas]|uniref:SDR family NAD(P)-dependent oxidoreductase n=1 Tax=Pseudoalteromonas obscura TaxID=3048491 RepID=A0ABT7ERR3_9GAMM|nr:MULTISPECIES: SDR family NAD(P)-dependent oxidoreductase [Pseudoalteromonas]MBQ4839016.1 SDR family NAD(P)-dependent oxidoreductase [Pseudoalteromonas luteoviolacea]MDK2597754.1 SDR family NAD(P)-dependent oxidoreductase [Pseudoalteromonas sp. P94(2023)]
MDLSGKKVLITGGGSGIGLEFTRELAKRSNNIVICGRNLNKLKSIQKELPNIDYFQCDLTKDEEQKKLVEYIHIHHPDLDMLINNAGIQKNYSFTQLESHIDLIDEEMNTNVTSQMKLIDRMLPVLLQQREAAIVNVTSLLAAVPKQSAPVYCASKAAFRMFTKALRYQLESTTVKVYEVVPPLVDTDMTKGRGTGKMSANELVLEALQGIEADTPDILAGMSKKVFDMKRVSPDEVYAMIRNG